MILGFCIRRSLSLLMDMLTRGPLSIQTSNQIEEYHLKARLQLIACHTLGLFNYGALRSLRVFQIYYPEILFVELLVFYDCLTKDDLRTIPVLLHFVRKTGK